MSELIALTAHEAARRIKAGELTSQALVESCLAAIEARDGALRAWAYVDPGHALAQARAVDARVAAGRAEGALEGVPVGIKDVIDTGDMPTEYGCALFKGHQPRADAAAVEALKAAGAVILGKTMTTELAALNPAPTRNPRNAEHTPGGSSSGSAAAVAAGMVPVALGTQTAGSVIRPAAFCGIYGYKPTYGLISRTGLYVQSQTLDTIGVLARSIEDLALSVDCMSAHDPRDAASFSRARTRLLETACQVPPVPPRLALCRTTAWDQADGAAQSALVGLVANLAASVDELTPPAPFSRILEWQTTIQSGENSATYGPLLACGAEGLSALLRERLEASMQLKAHTYLEALHAREPLAAAVEQSMAGYDAIVSLSAPGPAPRDRTTTGNPVFNGLWTYLGMPAVTLPLLSVDGMPLGVQLVGRRRDDGRLLRTARWLASQMGAPASAPLA